MTALFLTIILKNLRQNHYKDFCVAYFKVLFEGFVFPPVRIFRAFDISFEGPVEFLLINQTGLSGKITAQTLRASLDKLI